MPAVPGVQSTSLPLGFEAAPDFNVAQRLKGPSALSSFQTYLRIPLHLNKTQDTTTSRTLLLEQSTQSVPHLLASRHYMTLL